MVVGILCAGLSLTGCDYDAILTPTVNSVTVTAAGNTTSVEKGKTLQFYASVTGTNEPAQTVTWSIVQTDKKPGTTISSAGLLIVAADETLITLTIRATSTVDASKSGTKQVAVTNAPPQTLSGTITISPNTDVLINTELTAAYSGTETVTYQWKKDGENVGTNTNQYTPTVAGSYTVTVSAVGYNGKTSKAVTVDNSDLSGTISISPDTAITGQELTATYTGSEAVSYQWKNGENNVGENSNKYTPIEAGSYTVTVIAVGYNSKTSIAVTVAGPTASSYFTFDRATGTITRYRSDGPKYVVIPSSIDGVPVTAIGSSAFSGSRLTSVTIGANVTLETNSFNNGFENTYNNGGKRAGTYTRPNTSSTEWVKQ